MVAFVLAFAAGAILTMLADTMMPEAFEHGGKLAGVVTTLGFAVAFAIHSLDVEADRCSYRPDDRERLEVAQRRGAHDRCQGSSSSARN